MDLTKQQTDFITACLNGEGSIILDAVAGSGKTTNMVAAVEAILDASPYLDITCCAFNSNIAKELSTRMPPLAQCKTMHSLGFGSWARHIGGKSLDVNKWKTRKIIDDLWAEHKDDEGETELRSDVTRLVGLAKNLGLVPNNVRREHTSLLDDEVFTWQEIMDTFDIDYEPYGLADIVGMAQEILRESVEMAFDGIIDFDDMLYMPICFNAVFAQNDVVMIDEAQDISSIQREMLKRMLKVEGRLFAIGDRHQAIYAFRGAASDSIDLIGKEFNCSELPLTYSFRCPQEVVKEAQRYVPHIKSAPGAPIGNVKRLDSVQAEDFTPKDVILCRNTRPLVDFAFRLIYRGVGCYVLGSDMGNNLISLMRKLGATDPHDLYTKAEKFADLRSRMLTRRGRYEQAAAVRDRIGSLLAVLDRMGYMTNPPTFTLTDVRETIKKMFSEQKGGLVLSTIHKAKGLEWPRVFFLDSNLIPSKYAVTEPQIQQEENLYYVAVTRAQEELVFIESGGLEE